MNSLLPDAGTATDLSMEPIQIIGKIYWVSTTTLKMPMLAILRLLKKNLQKKLEQVKGYLDKAFNKLVAKATKKKVNPDVIALLLELRAALAASSEPKDIFDILKKAFPLMNENNL